MAAPASPTGLIDTDILIDAQRGVADGVAFLGAQHAAGGVHISIISAMELVVGARNTGDLAKIQQFLAAVTVHPLTPTSSQAAYQLVQTFCLSHGLLIPDALIAATALELGLPLFTRNIKHFQIIPGLAVHRPY